MKYNLPTDIMSYLRSSTDRTLSGHSVHAQSFSQRLRNFGGGISKSVAATTFLMSLMTPAFADDAADIGRLLKSGKHAEAVSKADIFLASHPRDPQVRFLKGLALSEQNKSAEAIAVFSKLTEDYPELPEPYNNLAVLFASTGQYDKSRAALEMAIRTNPSYATAHENLGDVYAKLASQAYDKALQLDSANTGAKSKLTLIRELVSYSGNGKHGGAGIPAMAQAGTSKATISTKTHSKSDPKKADDKVAMLNSTNTSAALSNSEDGMANQGINPSANADRADKQVSPADKQEILNTLNEWANAWSKRNVSGYLNYYSKNFETPKGQSYKSWSAMRRARITNKDHIRVNVEAPQISINGARATVKFHQMYSSDRLDVSSLKTLKLAKENGKWLITQESSGS